MRLGPGVEIQLNDNKEVYLPGDEINGDLLITTSKPTTVRHIESTLIGFMTYQVDKEARYVGIPMEPTRNGSHPGHNATYSHSQSSSHDNGYSNGYANGYTKGYAKGSGKELEYKHISCEDPGVGYELGYANGYNYGMGLAKWHASGSGNDHPNRLASESLFTDTEGIPLGHKLESKIETMKIHTQHPENILSAPNEIGSGVKSFKFKSKVPEESDTLFPSIDSSRNNLKVVYMLMVTSKFPMPYFSSFSYSSTARMPITIALKGTAQDLELSEQLLTENTTAAVGLWTRESMKPLSLVKHALGGNTAKSWSKVNVRVLMPALISVVEQPYYLQDKFRLMVTPQDLECPDMYVSSLKLDVESRIVFQQIIRESKKRILDISKRWDIDGETDITALISGTKIDQTFEPSLHKHKLSIEHRLVIDVGLKHVSTDGTNQVSTHAKISVPLSISPSALKLDS